ncbi:MAG: SDR family oxidoreductase [Deltaproteobacteria bacterium]|nr:SDR family oxidoreductase [Deltaproteobacteria bacterium]
MEKMLEGKVCVVTGGGRGIAQAACLLFAQDGGKVVVCDLDEGPANETVEAIKKTGGEAVAIAGDITADDVPEMIVQAAVDSFGGIDVIVNAAGYTWDSMIHNMPDQQWDAIHNVHLKAPFRILRAAAPIIRESSKAEREAGNVVMRKVVNISSIAGTAGNPGQVNYSSAKSGLIGMTKTLAKEWGRYNVNVNCIAYGFIETRLTQEKEKGEFIEREGQKIAIGVPKSGLQGFKAAIPLGRAGTADEAARPILFFASPLSDYVSGQILLVAGGFDM